jgi:universal stress protein E
MAASNLPSKILIVVDPTHDRPVALERAVVTAGLIAQTPGAPVKREMHILVAADMDNNDTSIKNPRMRRDREWFTNELLQPLEESGLEYTLEISWSDDWYGSILKAAEDCGADMIMLPMMKKPRGTERMLNESVWRLLRTASCPVLIVQPGAQSKRNTVLAAVNFQSHKEEYKMLNDLIIGRGQWIAKTYEADMHVVNAYSDSLNYPDRALLAQQTGVDTAKIHVKNGDPDQVIADVSKDINADIVVIGTRSRFSRWRGNTVEKIVTKVDCDILTINK